MPDVLLLAVDTATARVSVALGRDGLVVGQVDLTGERRHAEQLVPAIRMLCREAGVTPAQLAAISVGVGPGLFTGLRVGVTTATVMASALRVPVITVPTPDLLAYPLRHARRTIAAVIDARRREVFWALYRPVPGGVQRVSEYEVGSAPEVAAELEARGEEVLLVGDGVLAHRDELLGIDRIEWAGMGTCYPDAAALVELATGAYEREEFVLPRDVRPLYLRRSDAELEWDRARTAGTS